MKVYVDADEDYPVYSVHDTAWGGVGGDLIEVDEATLRRWNETVDAYHGVQTEIETAVKQARAAKIK